MGLILDYIKVYPPIEQYCKENDLIAEVKVTRDDKNPPHIVYSLKGTPDLDPVYGYVSVDANTGKVYLTLDGVNAINADYPDNPSKEITKLNFQILSKDVEQGDTLSIDVKIGVVRIHDEPPKIIDQQIYDIYQDDAAENERILDIRTAFPSFYYTDTDLIKIPQVDIGRIVLSAKGVDYVKNLDLSDPSTTKSLTFNITIQDQQNNLTLVKKFNIPIKSGSALPQIPKKSILEEVGANLGQDLAIKIETNKLNIENIGFLNKILFDENISYKTNINTSIYDSYISKSIKTLLIEGKDKANEDFEKIYETIRKNFIPIINTLNYENQKIVDLLPDNIEEIYNQIEKVSNEVNQLNFELLNDFDDTNVYSSLIYNTYLQSLNYSKNYINTALDLVNDAITYVASSITEEIFNLEKRVAEFKYTEYCTFKRDTQDDISKIKFCLSKVVNQICGGTIFTNCCSLSGGSPTILSRLSSLESDVSYLQEEVSQLQDKHLEDWGDDDRWKFTTTSSNGTLQHNNTTIINKNANSVTFGSSSLSNTYVHASTATYTFSGTGLNMSGLTLTAKLCDCTASRAKYADIAEYYNADKKYEIGTILAVGGEKEVTAFDKINNNLIGIVSDKPGFILNSEHTFETPALIGLKGRIKVKSKIPFKKADKIFADTDNSGYATNLNTEYLIGYALENSKKQKDGNYLTLIYFKGV